MTEASQFHVLLTNDDGHQAPGIRTLQQVLKQHDYRVTLVAPSEEQSATSMATTTRRNMPLQDLGDDGWHLDGQPADTVLVALDHLLRDDPPDLVLSGINFGPNLGVGLHASGTIGAAMVALLNGYPAIAISAGMSWQEATERPRLFPSTHRVLEPAAEFTCNLIQSLRETADKPDSLLPPGIMLNINYPPLPRAEIKGVVYPEVSDGNLAILGYHRCDETGHVVPRYRASVDPDQPQLQNGDVRAHMEGYITVSPIKPSWNPPAAEARKLMGRLEGKLG